MYGTLQVVNVLELIGPVQKVHVIYTKDTPGVLHIQFHYAKDQQRFINERSTTMEKGKTDLAIDFTLERSELDTDGESVIVEGVIENRTHDYPMIPKIPVRPQDLKTPNPTRKNVLTLFLFSKSITI